LRHRRAAAQGLAFLPSEPRVLHNSADAKQYGVSYSYPLSKRTDVYAAVARISNDSKAAYLIGSGNATLEFLNGSPTGVGVSPKAYEVGFRHSF
jgi:predicted porin